MLGCIVFGICAGAVLLLIYRIPRIWRGDATGLRQKPAAWPWGTASWLSYVRVVPSLPLMLIPVLAVYALRTADSARYEGTGDATVAMVVALTASGVGFVIVVSIVLINRPKFLVAPHLRGQPGALVSVWRDLIRCVRESGQPE
jgi:hypothetical protein